MKAFFAAILLLNFGLTACGAGTAPESDRQMADLSDDRTTEAASPIFTSRASCRAMATRQFALCDNNDCKALVLRYPSRCDTADCRAMVLRMPANCSTDDCRAVAMQAVGLCRTQICRAIVNGNQALCG